MLNNSCSGVCVPSNLGRQAHAEDHLPQVRSLSDLLLAIWALYYANEADLGLCLSMMQGRTAQPLFSTHALVPNFEDYSVGGTKLAQKVEDLKPQASGSQAGLLDDSARHGDIPDPKLAA